MRPLHSGWYRYGISLAGLLLVLALLFAGCQSPASSSQSNSSTPSQGKATLTPTGTPTPFSDKSLKTVQTADLTADTAGKGTVTASIVVGTYEDTKTHQSSLYALNASTGRVQWRYLTRTNYGIGHLSQLDGMVYMSQFYMDYNVTPPATKLVHKNIFVVLRAVDGKVQWEYQTPNILESMDEDNGIVYLSSTDAKRHALLQAMRVTDGKELWRSTETHGTIYPYAYLGNLYIELYDTSNDNYSPNKGSYVAALRPLDGRILWRYSPTDGALLAFLTPTHVYTRTMLGSHYGASYITAFNSSNGRQLWQHKNASGLKTDGRGLAFITDDIDGETLTAVNEQTGKVQWIYKPAQGAIEEIRVSSSRVFVSVIAGSPNAVVALNTTSGKQLWRYTSGPNDFFELDSAGQDMLYTVDIDKHMLFALQSSNGRMLWLYKVTFNDANFFNGMVYVEPTDSNIAALDGKNGKIRWLQSIKEGVLEIKVPQQW